jgi:hypothetical protein
MTATQVQSLRDNKQDLVSLLPAMHPLCRIICGWLMAALAPVLPFSLSTLDSRAPPRWERPSMENAMKKLLIAAVAAPVLLGSLPKAAPAAEPGVLLAQYYDGEHHREREAERGARWESFFHARMHEHRERDGYNWVNLPMPEKERVIRDEWERWGARRWGR